MTVLVDGGHPEERIPVHGGYPDAKPEPESKLARQAREATAHAFEEARLSMDYENRIYWLERQVCAVLEPGMVLTTRDGLVNPHSVRPCSKCELYHVARGDAVPFPRAMATQEEIDLIRNEGESCVRSYRNVLEPNIPDSQQDPRWHDGKTLLAMADRLQEALDG